MSRKSRKRKRARRARPRRPTQASPAYQPNVRQADDILAKEGVDIRPDNWQQLAVDWFAPEEPERAELARYIAGHEPQLGVAWARDILRLEVFLQAKEHSQVIAHYERALSRYPRCALVEVWVADQVFRHQGDFWRARRMYRYAVEHPVSYTHLTLPTTPYV